MWIIRTLTAAGLLLGFVLPAPAQVSENDSHCVTERNNTGMDISGFSQLQLNAIARQLNESSMRMRRIAAASSKRSTPTASIASAQWRSLV